MMSHASSPILEHENEGDDMIEEPFPSNGWCCFGQSCFGSRRVNNGETNGLLGKDRGTWLGERLRRTKEASELLAGPKWKNLIRKIGKHLNKRKMRKGHFQYDPQSYALNFNDGVEDEDDGLLPGFSARFAGPVPIDKCPPNL